MCVGSVVDAGSGGVFCKDLVSYQTVCISSIAVTVSAVLP